MLKFACQDPLWVIIFSSIKFSLIDIQNIGKSLYFWTEIQVHIFFPKPATDKLITKNNSCDIKSNKMIVVILTLALLTQAEAVHYEKIAHLPNPNNFSKSVYSHNYSFFLAYDSSSTKALAYRTYNWQPIDQPILTEFKMPPEHIEYYFSDYHYNFLYYNNDQG